MQSAYTRKVIANCICCTTSKCHNRLLIRSHQPLDLQYYWPPIAARALKLAAPFQNWDPFGNNEPIFARLVLLWRWLLTATLLFNFSLFKFDLCRNVCLVLKSLLESRSKHFLALNNLQYAELPTDWKSEGWGRLILPPFQRFINTIRL